MVDDVVDVPCAPESPTLRTPASRTHLDSHTNREIDECEAPSARAH